MVNGKIYVGCHATNNIDDGYMGSGRRLESAKKKYGIENFKKEILSFHETTEEMLAEEKRIVDEEFLKRPDVYNLQLGGGGGFCLWHKRNAKKFHRDGWKAMNDKLKAEGRKQNPWKRGKTLKQIDHLKKIQMLAVESAWTEESAAKRKDSFNRIEHQRGSKNSQFGTCWVCSKSEVLKIPQSELEKFLSRGFSRGRVVRCTE